MLFVNYLSKLRDVDFFIGLLKTNIELSVNWLFYLRLMVAKETNETMINMNNFLRTKNMLESGFY